MYEIFYSLTAAPSNQKPPELKHEANTEEPFITKTDIMQMFVLYVESCSYWQWPLEGSKYSDYLSMSPDQWV